MPRGIYNHYKIRNKKLKHKLECNCCICNAKKGKFNHKKNCTCFICKINRKEPISHTVLCKCFICRAIRGETKGKNSTWFGKKLSEKTKHKMSLNRLGKCYEELFGIEKAEQIKNKQKIFTERKRLSMIENKRRQKIGEIHIGNKTKELWKNPDYIKKMKNSHKGKKQTIETIKKRILKISGANNWNWKGGITKESEKIRKSWEYEIWRKSIYKRDNYTCINCGKVGGNLHAHHLKAFSLYPDLRFIISNGETLCCGCHKKTETYGGKIKKYENAIK